MFRWKKLPSSDLMLEILMKIPRKFSKISVILLNRSKIQWTIFNNLFCLRQWKSNRGQVQAASLGRQSQLVFGKNQIVDSHISWKGFSKSIIEWISCDQTDKLYIYLKSLVVFQKSFTKKFITPSQIIRMQDESLVWYPTVTRTMNKNPNASWITSFFTPVASNIGSCIWTAS